MSLTTQILLSITTAFSLGFIVVILTTMIVHWNDYRLYKPTYNLIKNKYFVLVRDSGNIETYRHPMEYNAYDNNEILYSNYLLIYVFCMVFLTFI